MWILVDFIPYLPKVFVCDAGKCIGCCADGIPGSDSALLFCPIFLGRLIVVVFNGNVEVRSWLVVFVPWWFNYFMLVLFLVLLFLREVTNQGTNLGTLHCSCAVIVTQNSNIIDSLPEKLLMGLQLYQHTRRLKSILEHPWFNICKLPRIFMCHVSRTCPCESIESYPDVDCWFKYDSMQRVNELWNLFHGIMKSWC